MNSFLSSWYFVTIVLGSVFIFFTRKAWNDVVKRAAIVIKNKFFSFESTNQEQQKVTEIADESASDDREFKKLLKKLNVKNLSEFNTILESVVQKGLSDENKIRELENRLNTVSGLLKLYMFSYLNLYLVPNSKIALLWLYNHSDSTKDMFKLNIYLSAQILNPNLEREAIFNSLLSHFLIAKDSRDLYIATGLGREFLVFMGLIKLS